MRCKTDREMITHLCLLTFPWLSLLSVNISFLSSVFFHNLAIHHSVSLQPLFFPLFLSSKTPDFPSFGCLVSHLSFFLFSKQLLYFPVSLSCCLSSFSSLLLLLVLSSPSNPPCHKLSLQRHHCLLVPLMVFYHHWTRKRIFLGALWAAPQLATYPALLCDLLTGVYLEEVWSWFTLSEAKTGLKTFTSHSFSWPFL